MAEAVLEMNSHLLAEARVEAEAEVEASVPRITNDSAQRDLSN